jgi:hypothetical protein
MDRSARPTETERNPTVIITVQIDNNEPLTDADRAVLITLLGDEVQKAVQTAASHKADDDARQAAQDKRTASAKKTAAKKPEPEPEPEPEDSDLMEQALARASELLSTDRPRVMKALKETGAGRVSEIPEDALQGFLDALAD